MCRMQFPTPLLQIPYVGFACIVGSVVQLRGMARSRKPTEPRKDAGLSWVDAGLLGGATFGILAGVSLLSHDAAVILGIGFLVFVIWKLASN